jgi:hypothetical protein
METISKTEQMNLLRSSRGGVALSLLSPKSEVRNPREIRGPKSEWEVLAGQLNSIPFTPCVRNLALGLCTLMMMVLCGCKSQHDKQLLQAYTAGQNQAMAQEQAKKTKVFINGFVKNHVIDFTPELTLAEALVKAEYNGITDPHKIIIIRNGQPLEVNPRRLLNGMENPVLQAGDVVELVR